MQDSNRENINPYDDQQKNN